MKKLVYLVLPLMCLSSVVSCGAKKYKIAWVNDNESLIFSEYLNSGERPSYVPEAKSSLTPSEGHHYEFNKWTTVDSEYSDDFIMPSHDVTFTANYDDVVNKHTVYWLDDIGVKIDSSEYEYGEHPTHDIPRAARTTPEGKHYYFLNWIDSRGGILTEKFLMPDYDVIFTANFKLGNNEYEITWKDDSGTVVDTTYVDFEEVPQHNPIKKESAGSFDYYFEGWYDDNGNKLNENYVVTSDVTFTAKFNEVAKGGCTYALNSDGNSYQVTGVDGNYPKRDSEIEILDNFMGKPVNCVPDGAFTNKSYLFQSVKIGNNVEVIGDNAFRNLERLNYVNFDPDKSRLKTIGTRAFGSCFKLIGTITFSSTIESIGDYAFQSDHSLGSIDLSKLDKVVTLQGRSFFGTNPDFFKIYVKNSMLKDYQDAPCWGEYKDFLRGI